MLSSTILGSVGLCKAVESDDGPIVKNCSHNEGSDVIGDGPGCGEGRECGDGKERGEGIDLDECTDAIGFTCP